MLEKFFNLFMSIVCLTIIVSIGIITVIIPIIALF